MKFKKIYLAIIWLSLFALAGCGSNCVEDCKNWQYCGWSDASYAYECLPEDGRCETSADCLTDQVCNIGTNECEYRCSPNCQSWQVCLPGNSCGLKEGFCDEFTNCGDGKECNLKSHECEFVCTPSCDYWQVCSDGIDCIPRVGYCAEDSQCPSNKFCDPFTHKCSYECSPRCSSWELCLPENQCIIGNGRCDEDNPCERGGSISMSCNMETHICEKDLGVCNPICKPWERCNSSNSCEVGTGFCSSNSDCPRGVCQENHVCSSSGGGCRANSDCDGWESCIDSICKPIIDFCNIHDDCEGGKVCDFSTHQCVESCGELCEYWESCNSTGTSCVSEEPNCEANGDCSEGKICNTTTHQCEYQCSPTCSEWEICDAGNSCVIAPDRCVVDSNCQEGQICNQAEHSCEYQCTPSCQDWQTCTADSNCVPDTGRCDENSSCGTTYGFSASCNLETHNCELDPGQFCDPLCKPWERCNSSNSCEIGVDRCDETSNCGEGKYCDLRVHTCEEHPSDSCSPICSQWEICTTTGCEIAPERCDSENPCPEGERCNLNHVCEEDLNDCDPACGDWEICTRGNLCLPNEGHCDETVDCGVGKYCDFTTHQCTNEPRNCTTECNEWEYCSGTRCVIAPERCDSSHPCPTGKECSANHVCEEVGEFCAPSCDDWQICTISNNCIPSVGNCDETTNCGEGKYCDLTTHTCTNDGSGCTTCESWEYCSNSSCTIAPNRCDEEHPCGIGYICTANHVCKPTGSGCTNCNSWETCVSPNRCETILGYCDYKTDCGNNQYCDLTTHQCKDDPSTNCSPICDNWELCSTAGCSTAPGWCDSTSDCPANYVCTGGHYCAPLPTLCQPSCKSWERCRGGVCETKPGRCIGDSQCYLGMVCDQTTHNCEYNCSPTCDSWETCSQDISCEVTNGRCDENTICSNGYCDLSTHLCVSDPNHDNCSPKCKPWQRCNSSNSCEIAPGYCNSNSECGAGNICNSSHICTPITGYCDSNSDCAPWQSCENHSCEADDGYCDSNSDCSGDLSCNGNTHRCERVCTPSCEYWETCSSNGSCTLKNGYCATDNNCSGGKKCNQLNHKCELVCNPTCNNWETCENGYCELTDGFCNSNSDCSGDKKCDDETHNCVLTCAPSCKSWESCSEINECPGEDNYCLSNKTCSSTGATCTTRIACKIKPGYCDSNNPCSQDIPCPQSGFDGYECIDNPSTISCDPVTHLCEDNPGSCDISCEYWEYCNEGNNCSLQDGMCRSNGDCQERYTCNLDSHICEAMTSNRPCDIHEDCFEWEICENNGCILLEGRCNESSDCKSNEICNNENECEIYNFTCSPACAEWQLCIDQNICGTKEGRCSAITLCDDYSFCDVDSHYCKPVATNCTNCRDWEICLENGCEPAYGSCYSNSDCTENKVCQQNACVSKSCRLDTDCFATADPSKNIFCIEGKCRDITIAGLREKRGHDESDLLIISQNELINGTITYVVNNGNRKGVFITQSAGKPDVLYSGAYVTLAPDEEYITLSLFKPGLELVGEGYHIEHYGMTELRAKKNSIGFFQDDENIQDTFKLKSDEIPVAAISESNTGEPFESMYVKGIDRGPFTVIETASSSNNQTTILKDSYDMPFWLKRQEVMYDLPTLNGQCLSNMCPKEHWTPCNLYCSSGFKVIQIDTNRNGKGDQCDNGDFDGDGVMDSNDNCLNVPNPTQKDTDRDGKGDACDPDLDGDGWANNNDNCPLVSNSNQMYTTDCRNVAPANATSIRRDVTVVRYSSGSWSTPASCEWECNSGYVKSGNSCVLESTDKIIAHNLPIAKEISEENTQSFEDFIDENSYLDENLEYIRFDESGEPIIPPHVNGAWGDACNHSNDSDKDGVVNSQDKCSNLFNPEQNDVDGDGKGDQCDDDIDGDKFLNNEDNCQFVYNPYLCKTCECASSVESKYRCTSHGQCGTVDVRGINTGPGKCHFFSTALRAVRGFVIFDRLITVPDKNCQTSSDCASGESCKLFPQSSWGRCYKGAVSEPGKHKIMPIINEDIIRCTQTRCMDQSIWADDNGNDEE